MRHDLTDLRRVVVEADLPDDRKSDLGDVDVALQVMLANGLLGVEDEVGQIGHLRVYARKHRATEAFDANVLKDVLQVRHDLLCLTVGDRRIDAARRVHTGDLTLRNLPLPRPEAVEALVVGPAHEGESGAARDRVCRLRDGDAGRHASDGVVDEGSDIRRRLLPRRVIRDVEEEVAVRERPLHVEPVARRPDGDHLLGTEDAENGRTVARTDAGSGERVGVVLHVYRPFPLVSGERTEHNQKSTRAVPVGSDARL